jgi:hypothetical protein
VLLIFFSTCCEVLARQIIAKTPLCAEVIQQNVEVCGKVLPTLFTPSHIVRISAFRDVGNYDEPAASVQGQNGECHRAGIQLASLTYGRDGSFNLCGNDIPMRWADCTQRLGKDGGHSAAVLGIPPHQRRQRLFASRSTSQRLSPKSFSV